MKAHYDVRISQEPEDPDWDAFLVGAPDGHHVQTSLWAQAKAVLGWDAVRVVLAREECIVAGAQMLIRRLPVAGAIGYVPRGPVGVSGDPDLAKLVIDALHGVARDRRVLLLVVQPPCNGQQLAEQLPEWGFRPSAVEAQPTATILIDVTRDSNDILAKMRKKTRQHIRKSLREGVTVREGGANDLDTFYDLLVATGRRQGFSPEPKEYFTKMWCVLSPHGYVKLFVVECEGEAVAAQLTIPYRDVIVTKTMGWSGEHGSCHPNEALHWEVIQWAKSHGYHYCDLEGINPRAAKAVLDDEPLPDTLTRTPTSFKLGFGGTITLFPGAYDYVYNPVLRWAYHTIFPRIAYSPLALRILNRVRK